jgi:alkylated DNA repair dioxygenase AlkB
MSSSHGSDEEPTLATIEVYYTMSTATMIDTYAGFETHVLDDGHHFYVGRLPSELCPDAAGFEVLWDLQPRAYDVIQMCGKPVPLPRRQRAYGKDYHFSGRTSEAKPIPGVLDPFLRWSRERIDDRLNGLLLNWYDGALGHYIGPHNDEIMDLVPRAPIVTVSHGEERIFRLTHPEKAKRDFLAEAGTVFVIPYDTNKAWKHSVPKRARYCGQRISITLRAFSQ